MALPGLENIHNQIHPAMLSVQSTTSLVAVTVAVAVALALATGGIFVN